jgi:hypothetical protein
MSREDSDMDRGCPQDEIVVAMIIKRIMRQKPLNCRFFISIPPSFFEYYCLIFLLTANIASIICIFKVNH